MSSASRRDEERVLVLAPTSRDAQISQALFAHAGLACAICQDLAALSAELTRGAGALVLTEKVLTPERRQFLVHALAAQPIWSDLPVILLARTGPRQLLGDPLVRQLGNVLVLERPISMQTLLSVIQVALRQRRRQYHARLVAQAGEILAPLLSEDVALASLADLLVPRLADCCLIYTIDTGAPRLAAMSFAAGAEATEALLRANLTEAAHAQARAAGASERVGAARSLDQKAPGEAAGLGLAETHPQLAGATALLGLAEAHLRLVGATAPMIVPLQTHEHQLGTLSLGLLSAERTFASDDAQVVQKVAERLTLALEQARLYRAEQAARAAAEAAVQAHNELLGLISHDLSNPLAAIIGHVQLLKRRLSAGEQPVPERLLPGVTNIGRAAGQMQAQIAELLEVARLQGGQPIEMFRTATDLVALAHAMVAAAQQTTERHRLSVETQLLDLIALVDAVRIERVLANLLSNAMKYSPTGGAITVRLELVQQGGEAWAVLQVQDEGIGIPAADLPHIFDRFRRASNVHATMRGTGLGLASVWEIVRQHEGDVAAANAPGGGATFTIRLPLGLPPPPGSR